MKAKQTRKPTNNELKTAITNLIYEIQNIKSYLNRLDSVVAHYVEFGKNTDKFKTYLDNLTKENKDDNKKGKTKVKKIMQK